MIPSLPRDPSESHHMAQLREKQKRNEGTNSLRISVLMLVIKFIILTFTLASPPPAPAPKAGSVTEDVDQPIRARKRSSERMAMAFIRRTETVLGVR